MEIFLTLHACDPCVISCFREKTENFNFSKLKSQELSLTKIKHELVFILSSTTTQLWRNLFHCQKCFNRMESVAQTMNVISTYQ